MTRKCLVVLLSVTLAVLGVPGLTAAPRQLTPAADQGTIRQIIELERQTRDATLHRDADFAQRTLADDYIAISPLGQVIDKEATITARKSGRLRYDAMNISDMVVRVYGNTAVVTARADVKGQQLGEDFSGPYRFTRVWIHRNGRWLTVSYQATVTQ